MIQDRQAGVDGASALARRRSGGLDRDWRAVDVWDSERVLLIDYDGPAPADGPDLPGRRGHGRTLKVLKPGAADRWDQFRAAEDAPMPIAQ